MRRYDHTLDATTGEEAHDALENHFPAPLAGEKDREPVSEANSSTHNKNSTLKTHDPIVPMLCVGMQTSGR